MSSVNYVCDKVTIIYYSFYDSDDGLIFKIYFPGEIVNQEEIWWNEKEVKIFIIETLEFSERLASMLQILNDQNNLEVLWFGYWTPPTIVITTMFVGKLNELTNHIMDMTKNYRILTNNLQGQKSILTGI